MREFFLRLARALLLAFAWAFAWLVWRVNRFADFLGDRLDALDLQVLLAGVERRTRDERKANGGQP